MTSLDHADNKLNELSDDERLARIIEEILDLVTGAETEYAVIGSCALQAYLPCFYRLPNDLDLVLPEEGARRIVQGARARGWEVVEQLGRGKLIVEGFPVHLIPESMAVIDKSTNHIFTSVDLSLELATAKEGKVTLVGAARSPSLRLASLESILFVEMIRPIYTGSVMSIALALRMNEVSDEAMVAWLRANPALCPILLDRVNRLPEVIRRMAILPQADRESAAMKLEALLQAFEASVASIPPSTHGSCPGPNTRHQ